MLHYLPDFCTGIADLGAAFLLMYGLHRMASPVTAPSGILVAGIGMAVAVLASFLIIFDISGGARQLLPENAGLAVLALVIGGGIAWVAGRRVAMTAMPQMVAIYNGMGGGAAGAIAAVELFGRHATGYVALTVTLLGALIGAISFSGSIIA
jgi:NAD(P) transhydrogenase subunit beta